MQLSVSQKEFEYLRVQRGDLDHLSSDFSKWLPAYRTRLANTFEEMQTHLPLVCKRVLDVGSGLGGINALIHKHYEELTGRGPNIHLLDGEADAPLMKKHDRPFNDMYLAITFLQKNGVNFASYSTPWHLANVGQFDLVMSFQAWCFHIHPKTYLDYVLKHIHSSTVLILDVRRNEWKDWIDRAFKVKAIIEIAYKYDRLVLGLK